MTDYDPQGLTWDQCMSVAYQGCAEVLAQRVQELERERDAARRWAARWREAARRYRMGIGTANTCGRLDGYSDGYCDGYAEGRSSLDMGEPTIGEYPAPPSGRVTP